MGNKAAPLEIQVARLVSRGYLAERHTEIVKRLLSAVKERAAIILALEKSTDVLEEANWPEAKTRAAVNRNLLRRLTR